MRWLSSVEALAAALNRSLLHGTFQASNATCRGGGAAATVAWSSGHLVFQELLTSSFASSVGPVSFNSTSRHFNGEGLEIVSSYNELPTSQTQLIRSAAYNPNSGLYSPLFRRRGVSTGFANTFLGFKNQTIVVCSPLFAPFNIYERTFPNKSVILGGLSADILNILSHQMEFRYRAKEPDDGQWGSKQDGTPYFTGCVGEVQRGTVLLGAGPFTKTTVRESVIDYTFNVFEESNAMLVPRPAAESPMWNVFTPFSLGVWLLLMAAGFVAAASTWLFAKFSPFTAYNLQMEFAIADEVWLQEYIWSIFGSYLQQGQDFYPFAMSPRVVLAFWWMFTVVMMGTYTGDLTAHLTITITNLPIKTLDDLAAQTAIKPAVVRGTNLETLFNSATSGIYKTMADIMVVVDSVDACVRGTFEGKLACLADRTFLLRLSLINCTQVYLADEIFNTATVAYVMKEDAYFTELINYYFRKLQETGIMQQAFRNNWYATAICSDSSDEASADPIAVVGIGGSLIVVGALYATGLVLLLFELFWTKVLKKEALDLPIY